MSRINLDDSRTRGLSLGPGTRWRSAAIDSAGTPIILTTSSEPMLRVIGTTAATVRLPTGGPSMAGVVITIVNETTQTVTVVDGSGTALTPAGSLATLTAGTFVATGLTGATAWKAV